MSQILGYNFNPIQCTEETMKNLNRVEGSLYFTTDTKRIFLDKDEQLIPLCGSRGLFYGIKAIKYVNNGEAPDPNVVFNINEIESKEYPETNDLILNTGTELSPDGCFYRVGTVDKTKGRIETKRLTLQGSGGGAGGGGNANSQVNYSIGVVNTDLVYSSETKSMEVHFIPGYSGILSNHIASVSFTIENEDKPFYTTPRSQTFEFNVENSIDLIAHKDKFGQVPKVVQMITKDRYGNTLEEYLTISMVQLSLTTTKSNIFAIRKTEDSSQYRTSYTCNWQGASSDDISNRKITYSFYKENDFTKPALVLTKEGIGEDNTNREGDMTTWLVVDDLPHGVYTLHIIASAIITSTGVVIESNELIHKVACVKNTDPLLLINLPSKIEQYKNAQMDYLLISADSENYYTLEFSLNDVQQSPLSIQAGSNGSTLLYFENYGSYTLKCSISELDVEHTELFTVQKYDGRIPTIVTDNIMLQLNPKGKSNNAVDRDVWTWIDGDKTYTAKLSNFHYGTTNGWMTDSEGTSYLLLNSGATLNLSNFHPFKYDPTIQNALDSRMGKGMTIELDLVIDGIVDYEEELIKCISKDIHGNIKVGFALRGEEIKFYNNRLNDGLDNSGKPKGSLTKTKLIEGQRIRLTYVIERNKTELPEEKNHPMIFTYLNGKMSGAAFYESADSFLQSLDEPATLQIFGSKAQIKIYGIRFYSTALDHKTVVQNYLATLPALADRQSRYASNLVYEGAEIDLDEIEASTYDLQIPYMKLTGGWATKSKQDKWTLRDSTNKPNAGLPTKKDDYRLVDVEIKYPKTPLFKNCSDYSFKNEFKDGKLMSEAYGEAPTNGGIIMYCQGTSSMEYPTKNLRLRAKKTENYFNVQSDIDNVEIICMKADYMESSGSHNTGTGKFIDDLYSGVNMSTPGQDHFKTEEKRIVTAIKGYPCLIFYRETADKPYKYIGKYNLNLDKATPEPFGFAHDDSNFGYLAEGDKYYEAETEKTVEAGQKVNSIHCFEFLDNAVEVCNFLGKANYEKIEITEQDYHDNLFKEYYIYDKDTEEYIFASGPFNSETQYYINKPINYYNTWYNLYENKDGELAPGWTLGFESRYPEDKADRHDADMLYPAASWLNALYLEYKQKYKDCILSKQDPLETKEVYTYTQATSHQEYVEYFVKTGDEEYEPAYPTAEDFNNGEVLYYTRQLTEKRFVLDCLERFKREYQCYFDKQFLLTYYLVTEALLMADSRVKNLMFATWGKQERSYVDVKTGQTITTNNYIFYPIFYDMDTMLGLDNTGVDRFNYYDEDTDSTIYNGDEVLWNFVRDVLADDLAKQYQELESGGLLLADQMLSYYNEQQSQLPNEAFYNGDADYKYINPARDGYDDLLNNKHIAAGVGPYLYAAQGDRLYTRNLFLTNRMKFLQGKYLSNQYSNTKDIEFRWYYPNGSGNDEQLNVSCKAVPPRNSFSFTALKPGYAGVKLGANGKAYSERFNNNNETKPVQVPSAAGANGTEAYIMGLNVLSDVGDLSNKYMQKFSINATDVRLEHLILGNEHRDYYNPYWKPKNSAQSNKIDVTKCTYLKTFNLQNCSEYNSTLNFANCPLLETVQLIGSGTSGVTLPINGIVKELRLPVSVNSITLNSLSKLTDENFTIGEYIYDNNALDDREFVIMGGEGHYENDFSQVTDLNVINTNIDTYNIIRQSAAAGSFARYYLEGVNWKIEEGDTQYCRRDRELFMDKEGNPLPLPSGDYYTVSQGEYSKYEGTTYPEDKMLYEKMTMIVDGKITCIPVLEYLQTKTLLNNAISHAGALSGIITISIRDVKVDELTLYNRYKDIYPNIEIKYDLDVMEGNVAKAHTINFYNTDISEVDEKFNSENEYYFTKFQGEEKTLAKVLAADKSFKLPTKKMTNASIYYFSGKWYDLADENKTMYYHDYSYTEIPRENVDFNKGIKYYYRNKDYTYVEWTNNYLPYDASNLFIREIPENSFMNFYPKADMQLVPEFIEVNRTYRVSCMDETGQQERFGWDADWNYDITLSAVGDSGILYYYKQDTEGKLKEHERYALKGWMTQSEYDKWKKDNTYIPTLIDFYNDHIYVTEPMKFYEYIVIEDAREVASPYELFDIQTLTSFLVNSTQVTEVSIALNESWMSTIKGKITLPSTTIDGKPIKAVRRFSLNTNNSSVPVSNGIEENNNVEIYFLDDAQYETIADNAFCGAVKTQNEYNPSTGENETKIINCSIKNIYLPNTIKEIGRYAFAGTSIENLSLSDSIEKIYNRAFDSASLLTLSALPSNLTFLGSGAFASCGKITIATIPAKVTEIPTQCFANCYDLRIDKLGGNGSQTLVVRDSAFSNAASNVTSLSIENPVTFVFTFDETGEGKPFKGGYKQLEEFYCYDLFNRGDIANVREWLGLPSSVKTLVETYN